MTLLLSGPYKRNNSNNYLQYLADAYMRQGVEIIFDEQNLIYSNTLPDIVHMQWPEALYRWRKLIAQNASGLKQFEMRLQRYKEHGSTLVYTVHNLLPHEKPDGFDKKIYALIAQYTDLFVHHGIASIALYKEQFKSAKEKKHIVAPHGHYYPEVLPSSKEAKDKLDLPMDKTIFTNLGMQRSYKGSDFGNEVFKKWGEDACCLYTVGDLYHGVEPLNKSEDFCSKQLYKRLNEEEFLEVLASSDALFLTHRSGLNSGLIAHAISFGKAIVFPDLGNFKEQADGYGWYEVYEASNTASAVAAIRRMHRRLQGNTSRVFDNRQWLQKHSWNLHVKCILDGYEALR